jgi:hypothetical protein
MHYTLCSCTVLIHWDQFQDRFGVLPVDTTGLPSEAVHALVDAKTLTINKLLSLAPASTPGEWVLIDCSSTTPGEWGLMIERDVYD